MKKPHVDPWIHRFREALEQLTTAELTALEAELVFDGSPVAKLNPAEAALLKRVALTTVRVGNVYQVIA